MRKEISCQSRTNNKVYNLEVLDAASVGNRFDDEMAQLFSHDKTMEHLPPLHRKWTIDEIRDRREDQVRRQADWSAYVLYVVLENKLIGVGGWVRSNLSNRRAELGIILHRDYHGHGFCHAIHVDVALPIAFQDAHMNSVVWVTRADNVNMRRYLEERLHLSCDDLNDASVVNALQGPVVAYIMTAAEFQSLSQTQ